MAHVLLVSKPVAPPWNDSGKNLVRDLARAATRHPLTVMARPGVAPDAGTARALPVYAPTAGGFAPGLRDQASVFRHLLTDLAHPLWHFFFAPNPRSCAAGRVASTLRRRRTIHTLSSAPRDVPATCRLLFADVNVVLSHHTERRFVEAGFAPERLRRIAPAIEPLAPPGEPARLEARRRLGLPSHTPLLVYPGDLEVGQGASVVLGALDLLVPAGVHVVMACRAKTSRAAEVESELRDRVRRAGHDASVTWLGETREIHALLGCADLVALPSADLYAKMDYPLVLLEAMSLGVPVMVAQDSAAAELAEGGGALSTPATPEAFAAIALDLFSDDDRRRAQGAAGKRAVQEHYSLQRMAAAYEDVYDQLS